MAGHRWRKQQAPPSPSLGMASSSQPAHAGCMSDGSASRIGAQADCSMRLAQAPAGGGQVGADPAGKRDGLASLRPTKRAAAPASLAQPARHGRWFPPGLPTPGRRSGGRRSTAALALTHSHSPRPQPRSRQHPGQGRVPLAACRRSARAGVAAEDQGLGINGACSRAGNCSVQHSVPSAGDPCTRIGDRLFFDSGFESCFLLKWTVIEAPQLPLNTRTTRNPCGRNVGGSFGGSAARRPVPARSRWWAGDIWPRISRTGSRWPAVDRWRGACAQHQSPAADWPQGETGRVHPLLRPFLAEGPSRPATQGLPRCPAGWQPRSAAQAVPAGPCLWLGFHDRRCCDSATPAPEVPTLETLSAAGA